MVEASIAARLTKMWDALAFMICPENCSKLSLTCSVCYWTL